jgi:predicted RND superfamily exporter protein
MILDLLLYYIYLLLLIVAVGPNVTSAIWIQRAMANRESLSFTLQGIKFINDRIVLPATGLITVTWIVMVVISGQSLLIPWILLVAVFWLVIFLLGLFLYTPRLRKQIALAESPGADSDEYKTAAWQGMIVGIAIGVIVLLILLLMVFQPALWG